MTDDELFERAEEIILTGLDESTIFYSLVESGVDEEDADKIMNLIERAYVSVSWPDNVTP